MDIYQAGLKQFWPSPCFSYEQGGLKNGWFLGQNQVTMAGSVWDGDSSWKLFITSNHINTNRKTWFRAVLAPAILPSCARGGQKWLILRSKSGHNGRVKQGAWNQQSYSVISFTVIKLLHVNALPLNIAHQIAIFTDTIGFRFTIWERWSTEILF